MRVLVTGGAGYIGSHTAKAFAEAGHEVWAYDNLSAGHRAAAPAGRLIVGELEDGDALGRALSENRIEAVVHFAALALVGESVRHPERYYRNNVVGTLSLMGAMLRHGVGSIVFSSTCATYGVPREGPLSEDSPQ